MCIMAWCVVYAMSARVHQIELSRSNTDCGLATQQYTHTYAKEKQSNTMANKHKVKWMEDDRIKKWTRANQQK